MNDLHIKSVDLNLLRVFDVLLEERNATRAGVRLGLSQSAVSHALSRLRYLLEDELFVRDSRGLRPTPRSLELGPQVHSALSQLQAAFAPSTFDPATTERQFNLIAGPYACAILAPDLVARMSREAPTAALAIAELAPDLLEQLDSRRADIALSGSERAPARFVQEILLQDSLVWVVRVDNPLPHGPVDLEQLTSIPHVVIARRSFDGATAVAAPAGWEDQDAFEAALAKRGLKRRVGVTVSDTYSALGVVRRSDMTALIPRRLAALSAQTGLIRVVEPPYESPQVSLEMLYLAERAADPAIAWMRQLLRGVAGGM
jgi:DNA-binding transcriptional LysR family regulator